MNGSAIRPIAATRATNAAASSPASKAIAASAPSSDCSPPFIITAIARGPIAGRGDRFVHNAEYFLIGRHFGFVPYFFPGALAIVLWLFSRERREPWRLLIFLAVAGYLMIRFFKTGGPEMLRMMNNKSGHGRSHHTHHAHGTH